LKLEIYAHRGACRAAPENTLAAFRLARQLAADGIELDVKLTADSEVVVIHDQTVDRTTTGKGSVASLKLEEIQRLDAGIKFNQTYAGCRVPTLDEVFLDLGNSLRYDIELTHYRSPFDSLPEKVAALVKKHHLETNVIFSSFMPFGLRRIKQLLPGVPVGLIAGKGLAGALSRSWLGWKFVPDLVVPHISGLQQDFVSQQHARRREVIPWTVNEKDDLIRCRAMGIRTIITDLPDHMRKAVDGGAR
jgi:glycerophosphoryl diester phosphodiesterase